MDSFHQRNIQTPFIEEDKIFFSIKGKLILSRRDNARR